MIRLRVLVVTLVMALAGGCASRDPPPPRLVAPALAPPPARPEAGLTRDEVVAITRAEPEASDAIRRLDARRFAFALDAPALRWFADQRVDAEVLDYLDKRSRVDWQALRGDVDPATPE